MVFYQIEADLSDKDQSVFAAEGLGCAGLLQSKNELFFQSQRSQVYMFMSSMKGDKVLMGAIARDSKLMDSAVTSYMDLTGIRCLSSDIRETTLKTLCSLLRISERNGFVDDDVYILELFNLSDLTSRYGRNIAYQESILNCDRNDARLIKDASALLCGSSLVPEIKRISAGAKTIPKKGHPVHYVIQAGSHDVRQKMTYILHCSQ